jgi:hypothetical protein
VPYPSFFIFGTYNAHILDISIFLHICLCIEYNHSDMCGMICTQHPTFLTFYFLMCSYLARKNLSEVP